LISFAFAFIVAYSYSNQSIRISFSFNFLAKCLAASVVMSFVLITLNPQGYAGLALSIAICAAAYFVILFLLKGFTRDEINFLRSL